jgi:hypothetical protein
VGLSARLQSQSLVNCWWQWKNWRTVITRFTIRSLRRAAHASAGRVAGEGTIRGHARAPKPSPLGRYIYKAILFSLLPINVTYFLQYIELVTPCFNLSLGKCVCTRCTFDVIFDNQCYASLTLITSFWVEA